MRLEYLRDPDAIYRQSFETVRRESDLSRFSATEARVAARLVHACAMPAITRSLQMSHDAVTAACVALAAGRPTLCDCRMVQAGISLLASTNPVHCMIDDPVVAARAMAEHTTRSAAQIPLWRDRQANAVIAIGNAPTALFRLIEEIAAGAPMPAVVLGFPVGFVGAAESKQALMDARPVIPHIVLPGRFGGSALAAAAVNALVGLVASGTA